MSRLYKLVTKFPRQKVNVKGKVFPFHAIKACRGSRGLAPLILSLGATWWRALSPSKISILRYLRYSKISSISIE